MSKRTILIYGASRGLGKYYFKRLDADPMYTLVGVSRKRPTWVESHHQWIATDLSKPFIAKNQVYDFIKNTSIDVLIYNVGVWEEKAFSSGYSFLEDDLQHIQTMVDTNIVSCIFQIQTVLPKVLQSSRPQIILTGSTSAMDNTGRPEVTFNATKFALRGIAQSLRAGFKHQNLAITLVNPGYMDTDFADTLQESSATDGLSKLPMEDIWLILNTLLHLGPASCPIEINIPAMWEKEV